MKKRFLLVLSIVLILGMLSACGKHNHTWVDATCTEPKHCSECGEIEGESLGHDVTTWETITESTCSTRGTEQGICTRCGETVQRSMDLLPHTLGEWEIESEATYNAKGTRVQKCTVCGAVVNSETYELSAEEKAAGYKANCNAVSYDELARNPDSHMFEKVYFYGQVIQVMEGDGFTAYRINVTNDGWGYYDDTLYVEYHGTFENGRILEKDMVTFYGESYGLFSYETVLGATMTIPAVVAEYIDLN